MTNFEKRLLKGLETHAHPRDLGLYIHVPFCRTRCHFCSFYVTPYHERRIQEFVSALVTELTCYGQRALFHRCPISTVYFGGGTPSVLKNQQLMEILYVLGEAFSLDSQVEITIEMDPSTVNETSLQSALSMGVNRLSFGVQTFEGEEWSLLGRSGGMNAISHATWLATQIGFSNVSLDLMYGLPKQTLTSWQQSLRQAIELRPQHISCYALTLEEGTRFHRDTQAGNLPATEPVLEMVMQDLAISYLGAEGYQHYEVSNFAWPGMECRHNLRYWSGKDYLGAGPSAQSYVSGMRFGNVADLAAYGNMLNRQELPIESLDVLSQEERARERVIFGLRMTQGVPSDDIVPICEGQWQSSIERMIDGGLLVWENNRLKTTEMGSRQLDSIAVQLL
ncbi:MAG: radical SAM family heme chaperone HemW [Nitrospirales bacterium]|nr:radical SAM family heme chaperone HemW [Nitrospira sp.]MDR4503017.1 radical SAM family heme chaperone HemW [Nitrospirales bacterium]